MKVLYFFLENYYLLVINKKMKLKLKLNSIILNLKIVEQLTVSILIACE